MHLLLSSQRIEAGKLRGLDTYLSYRIGLRTFSEAESAVVLDTPDAFHLPPIPATATSRSTPRSTGGSGRATSPGPCRGEVAGAGRSDGRPAEPLLLPTYNGLRAGAGETHDDGAAS